MTNLFDVGDFWHYRFQVAGKRIQRSTHERDRGRAEVIAARAYDEAVMRANGVQPIPTLSTLVGEWIEIRGPAVSKAHVACVDVFARCHLYDLGNLKITEINTVRVEAARNRHLESHSPATANHWLRILKLIVNWAVNRDITSQLPWKVKMLSVQRRRRPILPIESTRAWFEALDSACAHLPSIGTAVRLMYALGLRESEAINARWEWFDWEQETYTPGLTKGREAEPLPIPQWLISRLKPIRLAKGLVAPNRNGKSFPSGFSGTSMRIANLACSTDGITPHRLRATFATILSQEGVSIQVIQQVMRHRNPNTTMAYLEPNLEFAVRAQNAIGKKIGFR